MLRNAKLRPLSLIAVLSLALWSLGAPRLLATPAPNACAFIIGGPFFGQFGLDTGPNVAVASNGDTIEILGEGTFTLHPKSATGGGTFVHKDAAGNVLASGDWEVVDILSFVSYGSVPDTPITGGEALYRVVLHPEEGEAVDGILWMSCNAGSPPPSRSEEFIKLALHGGPNFNKRVSGDNVFLCPPP